MSTLKSASLSGRELYHAIWSTVRTLFYDRERLSAWDLWEHRFDSQITDDASAISFAEQALASLDDPYTRLTAIQKPEAPEASADLSESVSAGTETTGPSNVLATLSPSNIGYLRILSFTDPEVVDDVHKAATALAGCSGLILDLRFNSGGNRDAALTCCELFIRSGVVGTIEERRPDGFLRRRITLTPAVCIWDDERGDGQTASETYKRLPPVLAGRPLVVLVGNITASAAEILVMAVIVNGFKGLCLSVGQTTLGKGLAQTDDLDILGKVRLRVSCGRNLGPGGEFLGEGKGEPSGIEPDIVVAGAEGAEALAVAAAEVRKMMEELKTHCA